MSRPIAALGLAGAAAIAVAAISVPAEARRDRTVAGDVIKAARFLQTARLDDARTLLADLQKRAPDTNEVKWLEAELAFQSGDYAGALKQLDKVPDDAVDGLVGQTRKLAASTLSVTEAFTEVTSPGGHFLIRHAPGPDATIATLAGEVLDAAWEAVGTDLGLKPADPIRVELLGAPSALQVQQAHGRVAARDDLRLPVDGHPRPRVHPPHRLAPRP
jgi:hypothetical protein